MIKRLVKRLLIELVIGQDFVLHFWRKSSLSIIIYHNILPTQMAKFETQIRYIKRKFNVLNPQDFESFKSGKLKLTRKTVMLTFDDGFKSNRVIAEKILAPLGIKAAFFIATDFLSCQLTHQQNEFVQLHLEMPQASGADYTPMTWADVEFLHKAGHVIGSHTQSHINLGDLSLCKTYRDELLTSQTVLEKHLGVPVKWFAYPFGGITHIRAAALSEAQKLYQYIFSGIRGKTKPGNAPIIYRDEASPNYSLRELHGIILGAYHVFYRSARRKIDVLAEQGESS